MALLLDFDPTDWLLLSWALGLGSSLLLSAGVPYVPDSLSLRVITSLISIVSSVPHVYVPGILFPEFFMCPSETDQYITSYVLFTFC